MKNKKGFTLVELLVTVCIFSIIAGGLAGVLFSGINIWQRVRGSKYSQVDILLGLEGFMRRLRRSLYIEDMPFEGDSVSLEFPVAEFNSFSKVRYRFQAINKRLIFGTVKPSDMKDILEKLKEKEERIKEPIYIEKVLFRVEKIAFSYLVFDLEEEAYVWVDSFNKDRDEDEEEKKPVEIVPVAIKIRMENSGENFERVVFIPVHNEYLTLPDVVEEEHERS